MDAHDPTARPELPPTPIRRLVAPVEAFLHVEAASGIVLLACTAVALACANSPFADSWAAVWKTPLRWGIGTFTMDHSLTHWINDGLMVIFFFVIGLEVKREIVLGELREPRRAVLPVAAALGGMLAPAAIYLLAQRGQPAEAGWGIPMATDIAFVVGCLAILGSRVPHGLRALLLTLAIADDIGAILVIAFAYTAHLDLVALAAGGAGLVLVILCNRAGIRSRGIYVVLGVAVWLAFHASGVHATIAGVLLGLLTPARSHVSAGLLQRFLERAHHVVRGEAEEVPPARAGDLRQLQHAAREAVSPLESIERTLHPWVAFAIMPLFALANAGVRIETSALASPVALSVAAGLVLGKPLGILALSWIAVGSGIARLPDGVGWKMLFGGGCLAGIGFTMSIFIANLALEGDALQAAKVGVLAASALAALVGSTLVRAALRPSG